MTIASRDTSAITALEKGKLTDGS